MACRAFFCTIIFGLLESPKIILFKSLVGKIIKANVAGNVFFYVFFRDFELNYLHDKIFK